MNRQELLDLHGTTCNKAFSMLEAKNHDYTGGNEGDDPFANFRASETLGIPAEIGILIRSMDKFKRIQTFVNKGTLAVKGESVDDAIEDVINYMVLLKGIIKERVDGESECACACSATPEVAEKWVQPELSVDDVVRITKKTTTHVLYAEGDKATVLAPSNRQDGGPECDFTGHGNPVVYNEGKWWVEVGLGDEFEIVEEIKIGGTE